MLVELAGHVGLLLWGTHMVGTGVQRGFAPVLRRWLGQNLNSPLRAFATGLGITTLLQSSTATGLLATSFTATGVIALAPALAVMLGANVGTALLTQILSLNMALVGPPLVLAGVLTFRWAADGRAKNVGRIGIGLGLMLMALSARLLRGIATAARGTNSDVADCVADGVAEESGLLLRSVRDLRRIHSHLASFAYPVLHRPTGPARGAQADSSAVGPEQVRSL